MPRYTARHLGGVRFWERNGSGQPRAGVVRCGQMPVSLAPPSALTSTYIHSQVRYSNVCPVRDEEAAGSNPATPTSSEGHHYQLRSRATVAGTWLKYAP